MAWATDLTEAIRISESRSKTRFYVTYVLTGERKYRDQSFITTVDEYRNMTQSVADEHASGMESDTSDANWNRTVVTASVQRQNDAGAYKIVKTTAYTSAWTAWSEYA